MLATVMLDATGDRFRCLLARPNAAHHVISSLALHAVRSRLMAASTTDKTPLLITQNFDGLSFRALDALASRFDPSEPKIARERIIEMHGPINKTMCLQCKHVKHSLDVDLTLALSNITGQNVIPIEQLPRCGGPHNGSNRFGHCGGLLRPTIVWFDKAPEGMGEIAKELNWTDLLIIVGSVSYLGVWHIMSLTVHIASCRRICDMQSRNAAERSPYLSWNPLSQMSTLTSYFWDPAKSPCLRY